MKRCKIAQSSDASKINSLIDGLEDEFTSENLVIIYNHFISIEPDCDVLIYILKKLDKIRCKSSVGVLTDLLLLKNENLKSVDNFEKYTQVRVLCAKLLANLKDNKAVYPLLYCLNNTKENYKIRLACAEALGRIGDKYAVAPLIDVVANEDEKSIYLRESAALALGMIGDTKAVDTLVGILEAKKGIVDKFTFLKERVIEALGKMNIKNERVFKALKSSLMDESSHIRINAIEALMNLDDERANDLIKSMLRDKDEEVVKNAVIAIYNLEGAGALTEILRSPVLSDFVKDEAQIIMDEYENDELE